MFRDSRNSYGIEQCIVVILIAPLPDFPAMRCCRSRWMYKFRKRHSKNGAERMAFARSTTSATFSILVNFHKLIGANGTLYRMSLRCAHIHSYYPKLLELFGNWRGPALWTLLPFPTLVHSMRNNVHSVLSEKFGSRHSSCVVAKLSFCGSMNMVKIRNDCRNFSRRSEKCTKRWRE